MSADGNCCCAADPCDNGPLGACCTRGDLNTPPGCEQTTECECRRIGGLWQGAATTCPDACIACRCCQKRDPTVALAFIGYTVTGHIFDLPSCNPGYTLGSGSGLGVPPSCAGLNCNIPCDRLPRSYQGLGACCYGCNCVEDVTWCECSALATQSGETQVRWGKGTCQTQCKLCACVGGTVQTINSCESEARAALAIYTTVACEADPVVAARAAADCAARGGAGGGGGGGGVIPPVIPPVGPRPGGNNTRPSPCQRPTTYNPRCVIKVWFDIVTARIQEVSGVTETVTIGPLDWSTNYCDTLALNATSCADKGKRSGVTRIETDTDCFGSNTVETTIDIACNADEIVERITDTCNGESLTVSNGVRCFTQSRNRLCCDNNMSKMTIRIPHTGTKIDGVWQPGDVPSYTMELDYSTSVCVGYDRAHRSCPP